MSAAAPVKAWWQSKTIWLNGVLTLAGVGTYFAVPGHDPALTVASISAAGVGVANVVLRVWFTDRPIG